MVIRRQALLRIALFVTVLTMCVLYLASQYREGGEQGLEADNDAMGPGPPPAADSALEVADLPVVLGLDSDYAEYFVSTRMEREQVRARQLEWLQSVAGDDRIEEGTRSRAGEDLVRLLDIIARETELESLIRSKGFEQSLVFLFEQAAIVVVSGKALSSEDVVCLADMVTRVTGVAPEHISVVYREQ